MYVWVQDKTQHLLPRLFPFCVTPGFGRCGAGDPEVRSTEHIVKFFTEYLSACRGEKPMRVLLNAKYTA